MTNRILILLSLTLPLSHVFADELTAFEKERAADPLVGNWHWARPNNIVEIRPDGSTMSDKGPGVWTLISTNALERKYKISWNGGTLVDLLTLNEKRNHLTIEHPVTFSAEKAAEKTAETPEHQQP